MRTVAFLDLDLTYWNWGVVPPSAREAVRRAQENGHVVVANTSRTRGGMPGLWPEELDGVCCAAGMDVTLHGEQLVLETLGAKRARAAFEGIDIGRGLVMAEGLRQDFLYARFRPLELVARLASRRVLGGDYPLGDMRIMDDDDFAQIQKFGITFPRGASSRLIERLRLPEGMEVRRLRSAVDVADARFSKVTAMHAVLERLGGKWRTVALGDSANDIEMLRAADVGVAMGNAKAEVKAMADHITSAYDQGGLMRAFEHLGLV